MSGTAAGVLASAAPVGVTVVVLVLATAAALAASAVLVSRLERVCARTGISEAALGLVAALAANTPEITSAVTALLRGQRQVGAGVVLGSNVFNLAALLGLGAVVARRIVLHRRVVVLAGTTALWLAVVALGTAGSVCSPAAGLVLALAVFVPYVAASVSTRVRRLLPPAASSWLERAVAEEEAELVVAVHPRKGTPSDAAQGVGALAAVLLASVVMEHAASSLGSHYAVSGAVTGGVLLAGVTSLPNAVAAVYLARRGRAVAVLSESLNSNNLNVVAGLLVPATILGIGRPGGATVLTAGVALAMTAVGLVMAYAGRGVRAVHGAVLVCSYVAFVAVLSAVS